MIYHKILKVSRRLFRNINFILRHDLNDEFFKTKDDAVEQSIVEFDDLRSQILPLRPKVLSKMESLNLLSIHPKSFSRIGDGEIGIMTGGDLKFQKYDPVLEEKMRAVLKTKRDDLYVGICDYFHAMSLDALPSSLRFHRNSGTILRRVLMRATNPEIQYLHASCFVPYAGSRYDLETCEKIIHQEKQLFAGKKIALVTSKNVRANLDYDVFELASEKIIVDAPARHAFQVYTSLLDKITSSVSKDYLVCIILGPTATVMAADLTDMGYMAWDVGHIAKDYDAYMKRHTEEGQKILNTFWAAD